MKGKCYKVEKATYNKSQTEPNEHTHINVLLSLLLLSFTEGQTLSVGSKITSVWFCIAHCALELRLAVNSLALKSRALIFCVHSSTAINCK